VAVSGGELNRPAVRVGVCHVAKIVKFSGRLSY
jgi:hypothetical protein